MAVWECVNATGTQYTSTFASGGVTRVGMKQSNSSAPTETVGTATFSLKKEGTLTGTVYCKIWNTNTDSVVATSSTELTDSDISAGYDDYEFIFSPEQAMNEHYLCGIEYTVQTSMLKLDRYGANPNTALTGGTWTPQYYQAAWYDESGTNRCPYSKAVEGSTPPPPPASSATVMPPPYANIGLHGL